ATTTYPVAARSASSFETSLAARTSGPTATGSNPTGSLTAAETMGLPSTFGAKPARFGLRGTRSEKRAARASAPASESPLTQVRSPWPTTVSRALRQRSTTSASATNTCVHPIGGTCHAAILADHDRTRRLGCVDHVR